MAAAVLVLGAALAGAAVLYSHRQHRVGVGGPCVNPRLTNAKIRAQHLHFGNCGLPETREWAEPTALALVFLGLAGAATVLVATRRRSA
jgi:hypothetical protein